MFPLALGCPATTTSEGKEWIEPIVHGPADVEKLRVPDVWEGRTGTVLRTIQALAESLPAGESIREPDVQSPLGVAELMWDDTFYMALIDCPGSVHALLDKITPFIIQFVREVQRVAGKKLNAAGFPCVWADHAGTMVADDSMSLVSPEMHAEFSVPSLNRMADACGPLFYHSCTWRTKYLPNIANIGPMRACNWNPGNSDDPAELVPAVSGKMIIALHLCLDMHRDNDVLALGRDFGDEADFFEYVLDCMRDDTSMYWWFSNIVRKGPVMERIYDILHERGYTPEAAGVVAA